jgi:hypothetical protein
MKLIEFTTTKTGNSKDQVKVQMLIQVNYKELLAKDIERLKTLSFPDAKQICQDKGLTFTDQDLQDAMYGTAPSRKGLVTGMEQSLNGSNPDSTESLYTKHPQYNFIKVKTSNNENYITGLIVSETILVKDQNPEPYKATNSGIVVQIKNTIKKALSLETEKFRTYRIDNLTQFEGV